MFKKIGLLAIVFFFSSNYASQDQAELKRLRQKTAFYKALDYSSIASGALLIFAGTATLAAEVFSDNSTYTPYALFLGSLIPLKLRTFLKPQEDDIQEQIEDIIFDANIQRTIEKDLSKRRRFLNREKQKQKNLEYTRGVQIIQKTKRK
jgi:hypothetical protein